MRRAIPVTAAILLLAACSESPSTPTSPGGSTTAVAPTGGPEPTRQDPEEAFSIEEVAEYDEPWAMTFLPGTSYAAITQRGGELIVRDVDARRDLPVDGVPEVVADGQGGLGDVIAAPSYESDQRIYLSWAEAGEGGTGAAVGRARLVIDGDRARLEALEVIWRQTPKTDGSAHFGHRLAISPDGQNLFVSSGERQQMDPAQDLAVTLGKVVRLTPDGAPAVDNPFAERGSPSDQIWSYGHRNPLGLAFDAEGNLWESEMGPRGGDEVNLVQPGKNYGWPEASNGSHYSGEDIPDHRDGDGFEAPKASWNPSISPSSLMIYSGELFATWRGDAFIGALSGTALIRIDIDGTTAAKAEEWPMGERIREVEQGPDGAIWLLQDGSGGKLLKLTPR